MTQPLTSLYVAFVWHMHQPDYKDHLSGRYLMPWVRLHGVKDYLDMVTILEQYPRIRQTFNLVPSLIDQIEDYCHPETRDRHMEIMLQETFSEDDKRFILQRFFDASHHTMVGKSPYYTELLSRRNEILSHEKPDLNLLSSQEYADITALFHLVWFDPSWLESYPELKALWEKQQNYTLGDRGRILEIQRDILQKIIPVYKEAQDKGQIEITTTPYYHPILPLLIDSDSAKVAMPDAVLPEERFRHPEDAAYQVEAARDKYCRLFGVSPVGVWPAEQSVSPEAVDLLKQHGFHWAITSEGILSRSLGVSLEKDPYGNIVNAEVLCRPYRYAGMNLLFRNLTLSDLIGFHYASLSPEQAAYDLYIRLKEIQKRVTAAGVKNPIVTIALDGENCWESYADDGNPFLHALYTKLSEDATLNVGRVRDYFETINPANVAELPYLHSGSWINSNFHIWIADPVKNAAWMYLKKTRNDLEHLSKTGHYNPNVLKKAWNEIYIAEGSDWFWWYGEPHNSGQDDMFDLQFRMHLANVYRLLDVEIPDFLEIPLTITMGRSDIAPSGPIAPHITGRRDFTEEWENAGYFDLTHGAMHRATRILNKVFFGSDDHNLYLRLDINPETVTPHHEIVLYFCTPGKTRHNSPIRIKSATGATVRAQRYHYGYEIVLSSLLPGQLHTSGAEALPDHLWYNRQDLVLEAAYEDIVELAVPFEAFQVHEGEYLQFSIALVQGDVLDEFHPANYLLSVPRHAREIIEETKIKVGTRGF